MVIMPAIGGLISASMAALTMDLVILDPVSVGADGKVADSCATPPFGM